MLAGWPEVWRSVAVQLKRAELEGTCRTAAGGVHEQDIKGLGHVGRGHRGDRVADHQVAARAVSDVAHAQINRAERIDTTVNHRVQG